jgi:hypothetical protein
VEVRTLGLVAAAFVFALGAVSQGILIAHEASLRGLWFDEYWTLYIADPATPPAVLLSDTNTPFYYLLVRAAWLLGLSGVSAVYAANAFSVAVFSFAAWLLLARAGRPRLALALVGFAMAAPPALTYVLEARFYITAQFACFALAAGVLARLDGGPRKYDIPILGALSAAAAASHLYGALFAGVLGGAVMLISLRGRRENLIAGLTVGATACAVTALWLAVAAPVLFGPDSLVGWIPRTVDYVLGQFWFFNKMLSGFGPNAFLLGGGIVACAFVKPARPYALLFALTMFAFCAAPLLASAWRPVIVGRYLALAAPALTLMAVFAAWQGFSEETRPARVPAALICGYALMLAASGQSVAVSMTREQRWPFDGASARAGIEDCSAPRVRVFVPNLPTVGALNQQAVYLYAYEHALGRRGARLISSRAPREDVAAYPCRLVAWGEHTGPPADDTQLLANVGLSNNANVPLRIERRPLGFIVFRDGPAVQ